MGAMGRVKEKIVAIKRAIALLVVVVVVVVALYIFVVVVVATASSSCFPLTNERDIYNMMRERLGVCLLVSLCVYNYNMHVFFFFFFFPCLSIILDCY